MGSRPRAVPYEEGGFSMTPEEKNSKALLYMLSASVMLSLEKLPIFPPHSMTFSDLPEKNALAAAGTRYFGGYCVNRKDERRRPV